MKCRIASILLLLLVGASINVVVALSCSYFMYPMFVRAEVVDVGAYAKVITRLSEHPRHAATAWSNFGTREWNVFMYLYAPEDEASSATDEVFTDDGRPIRASEVVEQLQGIYEEICEPDPTQSVRAYELREQLAEIRRRPFKPPVMPDDVPIWYGQLIMHESGWPWRSMKGAVYWDSDGSKTITLPQASWAIGYKRSFDDQGKKTERLLPLRPKPIPFALNSMIYALISWLMLVAVIAGRGRWRTGRGRCPRCAYIVSGAVHVACPECGLNIP